MASYRTTRMCTGSPRVALGAVLAHLGAHGYAVEQQNAVRARLVYKGSVFAANFAGLRHALEVTAIGARLEFVFSSGWSIAVVDDDERTLGARLDAAMRAAAACDAPVPPPASAPAASEVRPLARRPFVTRCRYCAQITPVVLAACSHCGAAKFAA